MIWASQRLLNPFIFFRTELTRDHVSHPCVKLEHTAVLYRRILILIGRRWSVYMWYRELNTFCAIIRRCSRSAVTSPSHWILMPRCSKCTHFQLLPLSVTWWRWSYLSTSFVLWCCTFLFAREPFLDQTVFPPSHQRPIWIARPLLLCKYIWHSGQMCSKPMDAISSSVVSGTLIAYECASFLF